MESHSDEIEANIDCNTHCNHCHHDDNIGTGRNACGGCIFTSTEMSLLFEQDAQPLQLAALSEQEMQTTEGV